MRRGHRVADAIDELPLREGLSQQDLSLDERARTRVAGHEHDLQVRVLPAKVLGELLSAPVREEHVGEDEIQMAVVLRAEAERLARGRSVDDVVSLRRKDAMSGAAQRMLVVADHNR